MRAALGGDERVDLIDDDSVDRAQGGRGFRGEEQVERFGRGDEDFGRMALEECAFFLRGVAGADADLGLVDGDALALGHVGDSCER